MGKSIHGDEGTTQLDRAPLIVWMSFRLAIPGGVLSSMAHFRFTSQRHAATKSQCRSTPKQRMANRGLTRCLIPGVQFNILPACSADVLSVDRFICSKGQGGLSVRERL
jgi:hypothetical protein